MQTQFTVNPGAAIAGLAIGRVYAKPRTLPYRAQISTITIGSSEAGDLVIDVTDDETQQTYSLTVTLSGAVEATSLDEMLAAIQANGPLNNLFSGVEDGATVLTLTARHANRSYTITTTPPGSMTAVVATSQASGGDGIEPGLWVARGAADLQIDALTATTTLAQLEGVLRRTDANHFHALVESTTDVDRLRRGKTHSVLESGSRVWVEVEDAVTPGSTPYVRRALTSGAGTVGAMRGSAAGATQQTWTFTPTAIDLPGYGFQFEYQGVPYTALYLGDGTTTVAVACDGLVQDLGSIAGLTITDNGTDVTIQPALGTQLENVRNLASHTDVPADSVTVAETVQEDIDTIDVSSIAVFETSAAAGGLALLRIK